jgi:hypothetical protein|nr:MAG TPA: hypothetical protein [Caudoviricetes sp.]
MGDIINNNEDIVYSDQLNLVLKYLERDGIKT